MTARLARLALVATCSLAWQAQAAAGNPEKTAQFIAILQSGAPLFDRARACQQLGEIGTREAVPALAALLPDAHLSAYARSGLEGIPDPSAAEALRTALAKLNGNLLAGVINSLGVLRDAKAVEPLRKIAADPGAGAAKEALLALGRISTGEAIQFLQQALTAGPEACRPDAAAACLLAAEQQRTDGQTETAVALYDAVRQAKVPAACRIGATRGAILARKSDGVPLLIEQLHSEDRDLRNAALLTIRDLRGEPLANALNAELATAKPELQVQILTALVDCHNPQSLGAIQARTASEDPRVRKTALYILGRIGGLAQAEALLKVLAVSRDPPESAIALDSLERIDAAGMDDLVLNALSSATDAALRVELIRLLDARGATNAISQLLKQAADRDAKVSVAACYALKSLARPSELPALLALTKAAKDEAVREAAESAVSGACMKMADIDAGAEAVLAELKGASEPAEKNSWIRILTTLGCAKALPAIEAALHDANEAVADNALDQLGRWPDPAPIDNLLLLAETGAKPRQRKRALVSAIRLATTAAEEGQRPAAAVVGWLERANRAAQSIEDKRLVISALGRLKTAGSFRLLLPYLDDTSLQAEAALAVVQIAPALAKVEEADVMRGALAKITATASNDELRSKAGQIAASIPKQGAPVSLFDGRSLAGWDGDRKVWRVRDGVIVGGSLKGNPRNEFLATVGSYSNFILRLEYKLVGTAGFINSGVQFRSLRVKEPSNEMSGYQADIGAGHSGCLYDESRRNHFLQRATDEQIKRLEKPGDWNRYEVRCLGLRILIMLNGEKTADYTEADSSLPQSGLIGLQIHGGCDAEVSFRNLTVAEPSYGSITHDFGLAKVKWKLLSYSSENTLQEDERAVLAIDDNPETFWHTQWSGGRPAHPHHLAVDLGEDVEMTGFTYLPRQDGRQVAGVIGGFEFYVSRNGTDWGQPAARGRFENIDLDPVGRVVTLTRPLTARYIKLVSLNAPGGQPYAGAAELGVLGKVPSIPKN